MARPISKTTKFILSLPATLPAKEVIAKAKAQGLQTSENNVHRVRRLHGRSKRASGGAAPPAAAKNGATSSAATKSSFVRGFPLNTSAKEIVQKAAAARIDLDVRYVHKVQSRARPAAARKSVAKRVAAAGPSASPSKQAGTSHGSIEALLRAVGAEIGLARAVEILESERASVRAALGR